MNGAKKNVLFIGVTHYNLRQDNPHLAKKFEGLSREFNVFSIARGEPFQKRLWNCDFYLIKHRPIFLLGIFFLAAYLCVFKKIDTIVCQTPLTEGVVGVALKKLFRKELIVEVHGDWQEVPFLSRKRMFQGGLKKIVPYIGRFTLGNADKIRTLTNYFVRMTKEIVPDKKYFIFPTYTDIDYFLKETDTSFKKYILTVAVLSPIKNIETLIDAFVRVQKEFPDYKLVVAGDGPSAEDLKLKIKELKLEKSVVFTGKLSLHQVREAMKDCYVFVLPSLSEGFGRVFIEAMALSKPVIGSNVGGIPEIIRDGENGFLVEPKDIEGLAQKIKELLTNRDLAGRMGATGRTFTKDNFSNENYVKNFAKMIYAD